MRCLPKRRYLRFILSSIVIVFVVVLGNSVYEYGIIHRSRLNQENFDKIGIGMTRDRVEAVFGKPRSEGWPALESWLGVPSDRSWGVSSNTSAGLKAFAKLGSEPTCLATTGHHWLNFYDDLDSPFRTYGYIEVAIDDQGRVIDKRFVSPDKRTSREWLRDGLRNTWAKLGL